MPSSQAMPSAVVTMKAPSPSLPASSATASAPVRIAAGAVTPKKSSAAVRPSRASCASWPISSRPWAPLLTMLSSERRAIRPSVTANTTGSPVGTAAKSSQAAIRSAASPVSRPRPGTGRMKSSARRPCFHAPSGQQASSIPTRAVSTPAALAGAAGSRSTARRVGWPANMLLNAALPMADASASDGAGPAAGRAAGAGVSARRRAWACSSRAVTTATLRGRRGIEPWGIPRSVHGGASVRRRP